MELSLSMKRASRNGLTLYEQGWVEAHYFAKNAKNKKIKKFQQFKNNILQRGTFDPSDSTALKTSMLL